MEIGTASGGITLLCAEVSDERRKVVKLVLILTVQYEGLKVCASILSEVFGVSLIDEPTFFAASAGPFPTARIRK